MRPQRRQITNLDHAAVTLNIPAALDYYSSARVRCGFKAGAGSWFTEGNPKLIKNQRLTLGNSYLPAREARNVAEALGVVLGENSPLLRHNACARHTKECAFACLNTAGRGAMQGTNAARLARALVRIEQPYFAYCLDVHHLRKAISKHGAGKVARRANVISDYPIEEFYPLAYWTEFAKVQHYDYTKIISRAFDSVDAIGDWPKNYHLTYSASERDSVEGIRNMTQSGLSVAVVVAHPVKDAKPSEWFGMPAINGDISDERYLDPRGVVVLLSVKGNKARKIEGSLRGFVKPIA